MQEIRHSDDLKQLGVGLHGLGLLITLTMLASGVLWCVRPLSAAYDQARQQEDALRQFLDQRPVLAAEHQQVKSALNTQEGRLADLLNRIPRTSEESEFLGQLTELADASGVRIRRFSPRQPVVLETHSTLDIEVTANAEYPALCRFLDGISGLARLGRVTQLQVTGDGSDAYQVTMRIRIYFTPPVTPEDWHA